jgi:hypothetical protein
MAKNLAWVSLAGAATGNSGVSRLPEAFLTVTFMGKLLLEDMSVLWCCWLREFKTKYFIFMWHIQWHIQKL